jgi:hypothetical protein
MKNQPAAKQRDTLARNKGKIKAKNEILEEVVKWIRLGKDLKNIEDLCILA